MKQNELDDVTIKLTPQNMENIFNVYLTDDNYYFYNLLKTVNFPEDLDPTIYFNYTSEPGDTWPLIAWKHYTDIKLWWVVVSANQIINPVAQPRAGTVLKIIKPAIVRNILTTIGES